MSEEHIVKCPFENKLEENGDLFQFVEATFEKPPDRVALHDVFTGESYTFQESQQMVDTIAQNLHQTYSFGPGDRFGFYCHNELEYVLIALAVWKLRGVFVGLNPMLKPGEVRKLLNLVDCKLLLAHNVIAANARLAVKRTKVKETFVMAKCRTSDISPYCSLLAATAEKVELPSSPAAPDDVCCVLFSSVEVATVLYSAVNKDLPKAVEITHHGFKACCYTAGDLFLGQFPHRVIYQPFSHLYGISQAIVSYCHGSTLHIMSRFDLQAYLKCVADNRANSLMLVPSIALMLVKSDLDPDLDLTCVDTIVSGSVPLFKGVADRIKEKLGRKDIRVKEFYGLTETSGMALCTPPKESPFGGDKVPTGSIGMPVPGCEIKISSTEDGSALGPGKHGEVCIRGPLLMKGYAKDPDSTRAAIDKDGWFHTNDLGYVDENGYVFVMDRIKEIITYKGNQVSPTELENLLLFHDAVADAGVVGISDTEAGEVPYAWVQLKQGAELTEKQLQEWLAERVEPFKRLSGGVKFVDNIPKSLSGKVLRREIRETRQKEIREARERERDRGLHRRSTDYGGRAQLL